MSLCPVCQEDYDEKRSGLKKVEVHPEGDKVCVNDRGASMTLYIHEDTGPLMEACAALCPYCELGWTYQPPTAEGGAGVHVTPQDTDLPEYVECQADEVRALMDTDGGGA